MKSFGLHEVHSYIWEYTDEYKKLGLETLPNVKLLNASNPNIETIRRSMIPNQLCQVKINTSYAPAFGIFEIGRVVNGLNEQGLCREEKKLAVTLFSKTETTEELYFKLLHMLATVTDDIKHKPLTYKAKEATLNYIHPRHYNAILCDGTEIGEIGILHPTVAKKMDKKGTTVFAEIDINAFVGLTDAGIHYCETCKYPSIEVDVTYVSPKFEPIRRAIEAVGSELIRKTSVVDTYTDENGKAITVRLVFVHPDRTLVKDEVMETVDRITALLREENIFMKA